VSSDRCDPLVVASSSPAATYIITQLARLGKPELEYETDTNDRRAKAAHPAYSMGR